MKIRITLFLLLIVFSLLGQESPDPDTSHLLTIHQAQSPIRLDGVLDEPAWEKAAVARDFFQNFPFDTSYAELPTEVRVTFDDAFLYIGAVVYQARGDYIIASLKRDFNASSSDNFAVNLDPFQDKLNGFHFGVSPFNVQREGLIDNGNNITLDWDNKWYSAVTNHNDHWVAEMAIPFKTLRYQRQNGNTVWRINFSRRSVKQNEISSWSPAPRQFDVDNLAFTGRLVWIDPPPSPGLNISLIPYLIGQTEKDDEFRLPAESSANAGFDAKIAVTPSLNLDLTFNPDFSQVEVDRQLTNLSRFELFFPERRQFFLENEDLFGRFGFPNSRPFFSRRIGLAAGIVRKTNTDGQEIEVPRSLSVPIIAGMRLSGKLDNNWRIGLLNMQTARQRDLDLNPANYTVGVVQRKIFDRSTIGAVFVNKENFLENSNGGYELDKDGYNRVVGLEYNLYSKDNKWESEVFYHRSISAGDNDDAQAAAVFLGYNTRHWRVFLPTQYIGRNYRADVGFVPRNNMWTMSPGLTYRLFPKSPGIIAMSIGANSGFTIDPTNGRLTDRDLSLSYEVEFPGQSEASISLRNDYTYLFFSFDPTNSGGERLPEGTDYSYNSLELGYESDVRRNLFFEVNLRTGQFFNGELHQVSGSLNLRLQPVGIVAMSYAYNNIQLPDPYNDATFWLVGPRAELAFTRSLFFSTFLQYNTQANNININSRLQWRFRPVSDVFLVFTDNYFSENFFEDPRAKNRALVLKVTYWLNL